MTDEETSSRRVYNDKSVYKNILTFLPNPDRRNCMTTSREQLPVAISVLYEEVTEDVLGKVFAAFCPRDRLDQYTQSIKKLILTETTFPNAIDLPAYCRRYPELTHIQFRLPTAIPANPLKTKMSLSSLRLLNKSVFTQPVEKVTAKATVSVRPVEPDTAHSKVSVPHLIAPTEPEKVHTPAPRFPLLGELSLVCDREPSWRGINLLSEQFALLGDYRRFRLVSLVVGPDVKYCEEMPRITWRGMDGLLSGMLDDWLAGRLAFHQVVQVNDVLEGLVELESRANLSLKQLAGVLAVARGLRKLVYIGYRDCAKDTGYALTDVIFGQFHGWDLVWMLGEEAEWEDIPPADSLPTHITPPAFAFTSPCTSLKPPKKELEPPKNDPKPPKNDPVYPSSWDNAGHPEPPPLTTVTWFVPRTALDISPFRVARESVAKWPSRLYLDIQPHFFKADKRYQEWAGEVLRVRMFIIRTLHSKYAEGFIRLEKTEEQKAADLKAAAEKAAKEKAAQAEEAEENVAEGMAAEHMVAEDMAAEHMAAGGMMVEPMAAGTASDELEEEEPRRREDEGPLPDYEEMMGEPLVEGESNHRPEYEEDELEESEEARSDYATMYRERATRSAEDSDSSS